MSISGKKGILFLSLLLTNNQLTGLPQNICNLPIDCFIFVSINYLCEEFNYDCVEGWFQDQSNCCEDNNGEPNWTQCP